MSEDLVEKKSGEILISNFFNQGEIVELQMAVDRRSQKKYVRVATEGGNVLIYERFPNGIISKSNFVVPIWTTKSERNEAILDLYEYEHYPQDKIAFILGVSQSTVSKIIRKNKKIY